MWSCFAHYASNRAATNVYIHYRHAYVHSLQRAHCVYSLHVQYTDVFSQCSNILHSKKQRGDGPVCVTYACLKFCFALLSTCCATSCTFFCSNKTCRSCGMTLLKPNIFQVLLLHCCIGGTVAMQLATHRYSISVKKERKCFATILLHCYSHQTL
jgi:hypothetical protein